MNEMTKEIEKFQNLGELRDSADATHSYLVEMSEKYAQRIHVIDSLFNESSSQYEEKVKKLQNSSTWRNLEEMKSKLREQGQSLFELQEEVKKTKAKTDYGFIKADSLQLMERINSLVVKSQ